MPPFVDTARGDCTAGMHMITHIAHVLTDAFQKYMQLCAWEDSVGCGMSDI